MASDFVKPSFRTAVRDAEGTYLGTSHFYPALGHGQAEAILKAVTGVVIREAVPTSNGIEVFQPKQG